MRTRIYLEGKPAWSDNEPDCRARVSGYGGSAIGHTLTVVLTHAQRKATEDAAKRHPKDGAGARAVPA